MGGIISLTKTPHLAPTKCKNGKTNKQDTMEQSVRSKRLQMSTRLHCSLRFKNQKKKNLEFSRGCCSRFHRVHRTMRELSTWLSLLFLLFDSAPGRTSARDTTAVF